MSRTPVWLAGFKDPIRRPRYIMWTAAGALVFAAAIVVALGVMSTGWFCSTNCHKVLGDTIVAYGGFSHSEVSCSACHMPVGGNPVTFLLRESLGELYLTATDNFELPLNVDSAVALTMPSTQCTQCHDLDRRKITPQAGVLIDHKVHAKKDVQCTICHNRAAHQVESEKIGAVTTSTASITRHPQFLSMTACFRCHSLGATKPGGLKAPGACKTCHSTDFDLKPKNHKTAGFFPRGHGKLGLAETDRIAKLEAKGDAQKKASASKPKAGERKRIGPGLVAVESINACSTCHSEKFCSDCHGLVMPHPANFKDGHGKLGKSNPTACTHCHGSATEFCDECHHGSALDRKYAAVAEPWRKQHGRVVPEVGAAACFRCHDPTYCAKCHVGQRRQ